MFGRRNQHKLRHNYDDSLLDMIDIVRDEWNSARQTQSSIYEVDDELQARTDLARAKYEFLYREARLRRVKGRIKNN